MQTKLSSMYTKRWNNAVRAFTSIKEQAEAHDCAIWYEGEIQPSQLVIATDSIYIRENANKYMLFENDVDVDEGLYTSIADYNQWIRKNFKLVKFIEVKV